MFPDRATVSESPIEQFLYRRVLNATTTDDISFSSLLSLRLELVTCLAVSWAILFLARSMFYYLSEQDGKHCNL
jgi:hypothetical protein